jgi:hypothetical protein
MNFIILSEIILKFLSYFKNKFLIIKCFYINCEVGFIRKGIFGSILFFLVNNTLIEAFKLQIILKIILITLLVYFMVQEIYTNKIESYILFGSFSLLYFLNINCLSIENVKKNFLLLLSFIVFLLMGICFNDHNTDVDIIVNSWNKFWKDHLDGIKELYRMFN